MISETSLGTVPNAREGAASNAAGVQNATAPDVRQRTTAAGRDANGISPKRFALIAAQLLALLVVVQRFNIETEAFFRLFALTIAGFCVHYFLPLRYRLRFFVLLSLAAIGWIVGAIHGGWLVGLGLALIGVCHLPIPFAARVALLIAIGGGLALPRWGLGQVPWSGAIWPLLGSMFVFRLIVYMYDLRRETAPATLSQRLAYFFLLPNVCFPLFPVVDFKKFCRNYYDEERHRIYQVGVEWIWRGVLQLALYRLIYYHLTIDSAAVDDLGDLALYMVSTFMLYVRISGQFHVIVGILHLFGFNLPESHHRYFLASSFTDFWRRINIYWKDFMLKVFYYPAYFRFRKLGDTRAIILATIFTFISTWFLHMVQWFWIRGSVFLELNDIIFWTVFAALVLVNSLYEAKRGRARARANRNRTLRQSAGVVFRTAATFSTICLLWTFWTSESISDWVLLMRSGATLPPWTGVQLAAAALGIVLAAVATVYTVHRGWGEREQGTAPQVPARAILATGLALAVLSVPAVQGQLAGAGTVLNSLRSGSLNRTDAEQFQRGYYEHLLAVGKSNDGLRQIYEQMPKDFVRSLSVLGLSRRTDDEQDYELVPHAKGRFVGADVSTNRWGMRDKDYALHPPPGTYRLALMGPSTAMGSGVTESETFEAVLEQRLNEQRTGGTSGRYEVLNFGVAGYSPLHMLFQLERKVLAFEPKAVMYLAHSSDTDLAAVRLVRMAARGVVPPGYLTELVERAGLRPGMGANELRRRIRPYRRELIAWTYRSFALSCQKRGVHPIFVYFEAVTERMEPWRATDRAELLAAAGAAGFIRLDLTGVFENRPAETLSISYNDIHPNALGSRLIGERLLRLLRENATRLDLGLEQP